MYSSKLRIAMLVCIAIALCFFGSCRKNTAVQHDSLKVYKNDSNLLGFQVVQLTGGGYAFAVQNTQDNQNTSLYCIDAKCSLQWRKDLPGNTSASQILFSGIAATPDGGVVIAGYTPASYYPISSYDSTKNSVVCLYHYTAGGANDWCDTLHERGEIGSLAMCQAPDGNIEVAAFLSLDTEVNLINVSPQGNINSIHPLHVPDTFFLYPQSIAPAGSDYVITGTASYNLPYMGIMFGFVGYYTLRTSAIGNITWDSCSILPFTHYEPVEIVTRGNIMAVSADSGGNAGALPTAFRGNQLFPSLEYIYISLRDISTGAYLRSALFTSYSADPNGIIENPYIITTLDGGFMIGATNSLDRYLWQVELIKTDANLQTQWQKVLDVHYPAQCFGVLQTNDGGYMVFLNVQSFGKLNNDIALIKTDANGNIVGN